MKKIDIRGLLVVFGCAVLVLPSMAADVPAVLPRPDGAPASDGKVKVYILAGQSNMVGFGYYRGGRPAYPSVYLSADPSVIPCRMPVGPSGLLPFGIYQSADKSSPKGAKVAVYGGAYRAGTDYSKIKAMKEATVALGTTDAQLPGMEGSHTIVARAFVEVPMTGAYRVHAGYKDSTYAVASIDGKEVYRRDIGKEATLTKVELERGKRHALSVTYMKGGSAAFWLELVDLKARGDLATAMKEGKFTWFADDEGAYTKRNDVTYVNSRTSAPAVPLSTTSNGKYLGPEVPFGYVMGTYHKEHVLLIKSSCGNRSLNFDFRPPSSGKTEEEKGNQWCGKEYDLLVEGVHKTLKNIAEVVPDYKGQGYEITGFVWWQGHKDAGSSKETYEKHLVNLINDLRKEFKAPDMRVVVATVGFGGYDLPEQWQGVFDAQMAVGDPKQHPEFKGTVATVDTRGFWRSRADSPTGTGYHYNHNAETYVLTGDTLGREMVKLLGGKAEPLVIPSPPEQHPDVQRLYSNEIVATYDARSRQKSGKRSENPTRDGYLKMEPALRPIIRGSMIPEFLENSLGAARKVTHGRSLEAIVRGGQPMAGLKGDIGVQGLDVKSQLDTLQAYYEALGIDDYSWKHFGPEMRTAKWNYYSFDPPEKQPLDKSNRLREITFPKGMENWFSPDFEPDKVGWKVGNAPFGQMDGVLKGRKKKECWAPYCDCDKKPATLWEKEVLLMQQTFELPPLKEGHVYRVLLGGSNCDRSGEGVAVYVNGKLIMQSKGGFFKRGGVRGAYLLGDVLQELRKGGKVTIAVLNFLRYTHFANGRKYWGTNPDYRGKEVPPNGNVSLWLQEARLSPETIAAAAEL